MATNETVDLELPLPDVYAKPLARRLAGLEEGGETTPVSYGEPSEIHADDWQVETRWQRCGVYENLQSLQVRNPVLLWLHLDQPAFDVMVASAWHWDAAEVTSTMTPFRNAPQAGDVDWDRWHELLDKSDHGGLSGAEEAEYEHIRAVVEQLDANEARVADEATARLVERHERVLFSIQRLTMAVRAATEQA